MNELTVSDFCTLMGLIANSLSRPDTSSSSDIQKFRESLTIEEDTWNLLLPSLIHVFKMSLKFIFKPTTLQRHLEDDLKLDSEKAKEFVKQWSLCTKRDFGDIENRYKLNDVVWQLNMQVASSVHNKETIPNARLQFNMSQSKSEEKEYVTLELNCDELVQLYNALENMQNKLDFVTD